jgi:hypothetical protein
MRRLAALLLVMVASARCGSGDTPDLGGAGGAVTQEAFPETFATTYCNGIAACCERAGYSSAACHATALQTMTALVAYETAQAGVVFDGAIARRCLDAYATALRACTSHALAEQIGVACYGVFRSSSTTPTSPPNDCVAHAHLGETCAGSCVGDPLASSTCSIGWSSDPWQLCWTEDGVYCASGTCAALPTLGQACGDASYCGVDTRCQGGTCVANVPAGGKCGRSDDCLAADYCDTSTFSCAPILANGSACGEDRDCAGGQCNVGLCRNWSMATALACAGQFD